MTRRLLIVLGVACVAAGVIVLPKQPVQPASLAARVEAADPTWANYDEDVKAQVGARGFSEWRGEPVSARREGDVLQVEVALEGPWAGRSVALPLLLRTPLRVTYAPADAAVASGKATYRFELGREDAEASLSWVELRYPRGEATLNVLDEMASR
jgi:hypothetical protein